MSNKIDINKLEIHTANDLIFVQGVNELKQKLNI